MSSCKELINRKSVYSDDYSNVYGNDAMDNDSGNILDADNDRDESERYEKSKGPEKDSKDKKKKKKRKSGKILACVDVAEHDM